LTHPSEISARFQTTFHFDLPGGVAARGICQFEPPKIVSAVGLAAPGSLTLGSAPYF